MTRCRAGSMIEQAILEAIRRACYEAGSQLKLAKMSGLSQGHLSDYLCGRRKVRNMTVGTLERLFPELHIRFRDYDKQSAEDPIDRQIRSLLQGMNPEEKARCLKLLAANFSYKVLKSEEPKSQP